ncbi:Neuroblastoma suppressor of tumorigenicity 1 [Trichoplax sp. H2]|uniref:CTCK domain-containing protein n=1 Tax=Trichoplax adhaerens TaxID=10228 RepID=B3RZY0_TRIAD|nr:expressed hypothetical protein [Trichoplax adhaerens]EDV24292.1 expressed hypothetical protein [Trichoplax adhaerens]RDD40365.1 Neuroblastoma suppressor of tumorigenicity 1 [Trichoplax sp. H2]|eukprot:XP_002113818.1 expressed hypothetical protein [Trichoplax adhaerens]
MTNNRLLHLLTILATITIITASTENVQVNSQDKNSTNTANAELYDHQTSNSVEDSINSHHSYGISQLPIAPNQKAWCKLAKIEQVLSHPGCISKTISNHICVGQCYSYRIPKSYPPEAGQENLQHCECCHVVDHTWNTVELKCPTLKNNVDKLVQYIRSCDCRRCHHTKS